MMDNWRVIAIFGIFLILLTCSPGGALLTGRPETWYLDTITKSNLIIYGNLSHVKKIVFEVPINQTGDIFTEGEFTILDVLRVMSVLLASDRMLDTGNI